MNKRDIKRVLKISNDLGWNLKIDSKEFTFSKFSPSGYDFKMELNASNLEELIKEIDSYYEGYDVSSETYLWLDSDGHGKNGSPYNMKDLYNDFEACETMIKELYDSLSTLIQ